MPEFHVFDHPRVIFESVPDEIYDELVRFVPHSVRVSADDDIHDSEFDLLVTYERTSKRFHRGLQVFSVGADELSWMFSRDDEVLPTKLSIPETFPDELSALVKETLVREFPPGRKLTWRKSSSSSGSWTPLIYIGDELHVGAMIAAVSENQICLALPRLTHQIPRWFMWYLNVLSSSDQDRFPGRPNWSEQREWSGPEVVSLTDSLDALRSERARIEAELSTNETSLREQLAIERAKERDGHQRLLTADGDELSDAVSRALEVLGFAVQDMDGHHDAKTGAKLEDLRVTTADDPEWILLAEVKGYTKGAKVNDLAQIVNRPVLNFLRDHGREPDGLWHIVNAHRGQDPSVRPKAISDDQELARLTEQEGALIDTRNLFAAVRAVELGQAESATVRASMRSARTRWQFEP
jgi:hypothetical protein